MPYSQQLVPAFRFLTARALRASLLGAALLSLACSSDQKEAPLNPINFSLDEIAALERTPGGVATGLVPNSAQRIRLAADTTRCLAVGDDPTKIGNPVIVALCGPSTKMLFTYTSASEIRTSVNSCIGAYSGSEGTKIGVPVTVVACNGAPASKWTYDAAQHLANNAGGCYTVQGITLTAAAKAKTATCVSPAPWSQKVEWITPGGSPVPTPTPTIASITVSPAANTLVKGDSVRLTPTAYNSSSQPVAAAFTWSIKSGTSLVSVTQTGWVKALEIGAATVAASSAGITGTASVSVTSPTTTPSPTITSISISPATNTLVKGDSVRLTPTAHNSSGQPVAATFTWSVTNGTALASVSQTGWVKTLGVGTATVAASSAGKSGTATINITTAPTPPPPGAVPSIPPTLPLSSVNTSWRAPTGKSIAVHAGDNLQTALNTAQRGDEIVIDAGATFTGAFVLPAKTGTSANGWITVRTSALGSLPQQGSRIVPAQHASAMPKLIANTVAEVLRTQTGASGWRIVGIEMTVIPNLGWVHNGLVLLGDGSGIQKTLSQVPSDLILDRVYIHGQPSVSLKRCVALNSAHTAIIDSQLLECHGRGFDSQAILGWNGPGPFLIQNNRLEGAGEIIMFGGVTPAIPNLVPSDITIRRNYLYRPMSWKGVWTVKNLFELKNAQRVLFEGNVLENNWVDGQVGYALVFGSADTQYSWCVVQDVMFRYNQVHNSAGAVNLFEHYGSAISMKRIALLNNLFTGIGASGLGTNGRMFQFTDGLDDIWIENNTGFAPITYMTFNAYTKPMNRFTYRNNIGGAAQYNLHSPEGMGQAALNKHLTSPYVYAGNVFVGKSTLMPTSNAYAPSITSVGFVNPTSVGGTWSLSSLSLFLSIGMGGSTPGVSWANLVAQLANVRI